MKRSVAENVRRHVASARSGGFVHTADLVGRFESRAGVEVALSRLAASEARLVRVRRGLYWRPPNSRFGKAKPRPFDVAIEVARASCRGVGPAGWTALRALGLTTQVPVKEELAVSGAPPSRVPGVIFHSRSNPDRADLSYFEIAALEALRTGPMPGSEEWSKAVRSIAALVADRRIRWNRLHRASANEPPRVRASVAALHSAIGTRDTSRTRVVA